MALDAGRDNSQRRLVLVMSVVSDPALAHNQAAEAALPFRFRPEVGVTVVSVGSPLLIGELGTLVFLLPCVCHDLVVDLFGRRKTVGRRPHRD